MTETLIGYARCSTDAQDLTAQRDRLRELGVAEDRTYLDHGLTDTTRSRPGLDQALAAVRAGDTLVVPKLDRLARSVPGARAIGDDLSGRGIKLSFGGQVYDPADPMGKMFFNILATSAEFEVDLLRMRTREGMAVARAKGKQPGQRRPGGACRPHPGQPSWVPILASIAGLSQEQLKNVLRHRLGTSGWITLAREHPRSVIEMLNIHYGLVDHIEEERSRPWSYADILFERVESRSRASRAIGRGRDLEDEVEEIVKSLGLPYALRTHFTGTGGRTAPCDLAIP